MKTKNLITLISNMLLFAAMGLIIGSLFQLLIWEHNLAERMASDAWEHYCTIDRATGKPKTTSNNDKYVDSYEAITSMARARAREFGITGIQNVVIPEQPDTCIKISKLVRAARHTWTKHGRKQIEYELSQIFNEIDYWASLVHDEYMLSYEAIKATIRISEILGPDSDNFKSAVKYLQSGDWIKAYEATRYSELH